MATTRNKVKRVYYDAPSIDFWHNLDEESHRNVFGYGRKPKESDPRTAHKGPTTQAFRSIMETVYGPDASKDAERAMVPPTATDSHTMVVGDKSYTTKASVALGDTGLGPRPSKRNKPAPKENRKRKAINHDLTDNFGPTTNTQPR